MLVPRSKYLKQLDDLSVAMEDLGQKTIADVTAAGLALAKGDVEAAEEVISGEMRMRRLRATIEDTCLDIMLMQQPLVADDLRYVSGSFRLVSDLAHIDSKARDVAYLATQIPHEAASAIETEIATASGKVAYMVKTALESFADADRDRAEEVFASDDEVDALYERAEQVVVDLIRKGDADATHLSELLMAAKYFERMGDEVRNAAKGICRLANPAVGQAGEALTELVSVLERLKGMADKMNAALLSMDAKAARHLVEERDLVSEQVHDALTATVSRMKMNAVTLDDGLEFIRINRALERVAAHMQNIGEAIIFIVEGLDIRHEKIAHEEDSDDDDEAD